jgi:hypothetical protein
VVEADAQFRCVNGGVYDQVLGVGHCARPATVEAGLAVEVADRWERSTTLPWQVVVAAQMAELAVIVKSAAVPQEERTAPLHSLPLQRCHSAFSSDTSDRGRKSGE